MTDDVFEDLVNLYLDKEITPVQLDILRRELEENPGRQKVFKSYCRIHQATHFVALRQCSAIPTPGKSMVRGPHFLGQIFGNPAWSGAVLTLVIAASITLYLKNPFVSVPDEEEPIMGSVAQIDRFQAEVEPPPIRSATLDLFRTLQAQGQPQRNWGYRQEWRPLRASPDYLPSYQTEEDFPFSFPSGSAGFLVDQEPESGFDFEHSSYEFKR